MSDLSFEKVFLKQKGGLVAKLHQKPKKPPLINRPTYDVRKPNTVHQADVLYLPKDSSGVKYLLVVVDVNNGKTTAEPLKRIADVPEAIKKIYMLILTYQ